MKVIKIYLAVVTTLLVIGIAFGIYVWYTVQKIDTEVGGVIDTKSATVTSTSQQTSSVGEKEPVALPKEPITVKTADLTSTQQSALKTFGIEGDSFTITPAMISCAEDVLGNARLAEILAGASPSVIESMKLLPCFKK